jgi:hypothetical protein
MREALDECNRNDIVTIVPAGNDGLLGRKLHEASMGKPLPMSQTFADPFTHHS